MKNKNYQVNAMPHVKSNPSKAERNYQCAM